MSRRRRVVTGFALIVGLFLFIQLSALALVQPFGAEYQPVENPEDPGNSLVYVVAILVFTGVILLGFRLGGQSMIRAMIVLAGSWLSLYVFLEIVPPVVTVGGQNVLALGLAVGLAAALYVYPEWYVVDAAGALMGAAAAGLFGISLGILPALVLLVVLAVYDAISVYGTEHMLDLASGVLDLKVPVVLVIPMSASYSFLDDGPPDPAADGAGEEAVAVDADRAIGEDASTAEESAAEESAAEESVGKESVGEEGVDDLVPGDPLEREVMFIGLGDAVIPTVLVASAAYFLPDGVRTVVGVPLPALTAMVGTFVGLALLLRMVMKGRPHAGLPLLNGGTIAGYVLGALVSGMSLVAALGLEAYL